MPDLSLYKSQFLGKWPQRYEVYDLSLKANEPLLDVLIEQRFFDFHTTNHGRIVSKHQIVAYFKCGGIDALKRGFTCPQGEYEIHHIDGKTSNNQPKNLVYLPTVLHQEITISQRRICKYLRVFGRKRFDTVIGKLKDLVIWNRQGRAVKNVIQFVCCVLTKTLVNSAKTFGVFYNKSQISKWLNKIRKAIASNIPTFWQDATWIVVSP